METGEGTQQERRRTDWREEAKEGERGRKSIRERDWSEALPWAQHGHYGSRGECECTGLLQIHWWCLYTICSNIATWYQRITGESWPKGYCRQVSSGTWRLGTEGLFLLNEGRIPDSFALKGSSFECVPWQTSVWITKTLHSLRVVFWMS